MNQVAPAEEPFQIGSRHPTKLLAVIVSWNRPHFLRRTLDSLFLQLKAAEADVIAVDNGSDAPTRQLLQQERRLSQVIQLTTNIGINAALEAALPADLDQKYHAILVSDADMEYLQPIASLLPALESIPQVGAISLQHSPEHAVTAEHDDGQRHWLLKSIERGCSLLFLTRRFQQFRPLPIHKPLDFDWWVMRDAPHSLAQHRESVLVLPGGARHLGWRVGDSTWQFLETPEYEENRI